MRLSLLSLLALLPIAALLAGCEGAPAESSPNTTTTTGADATDVTSSAEDSAEPTYSKPTIALTSPEDAASVTANVALKAEITVDPQLSAAAVRFFVDGQQVAQLDEPPWQGAWDTSSAADGQHEVRAEVVDTLGQRASAKVTVQIQRAGPTVGFIAPAASAMLDGGSVPVAIDLKLGETVTTVAVSALRGEEIAVIGSLSGPPWTLQWDAAKVPGGKRLLRAIAKDSAGNSGTALRHVVIDRPPKVSISKPQDGESTKGTMTVAASATDDVGLLNVSVQVDGKLVASEAASGTTHGLQHALDTTKLSGGKHTIVVTALDSAHKKGDAQVTIVVDQPATASMHLCPSVGAANCPTMPKPPQTITGKAAITVQLQDDDSQLAKVTIAIDGKELSTLQKAPFSAAWDTAQWPDGPHELTATAHTTKSEALKLSAAVTLNNCDVDTDGYQAASCGGTDCDDGDVAVHPGAKDLLGDGLDSDCDGGDGTDADKDGFFAESSGGKDCDDTNKAVHPCHDDKAGDGVDSNCDGKDEQACDDCNVCTVDTAAGELCLHPPFGDGAKCEDGLPCTGGETCKGGKCVYADKKSCDDGNVCTTDSCTAKLGCAHSPAKGPCNDGSVCSTTDACSDGACKPTKMMTCDDGKPCTADSCDPKKGCQATPMPAAAACVSGCQVGACQDNQCVGQAPAIWSKTPGDKGRVLAVTGDGKGQLLVAGWKSSVGGQQFDGWTALVSTSGTVIGSNSVQSDAAFIDIAPVFDQQFAAVGAQGFSGGQQSGLLVYVDGSGKLLKNGSIPNSAAMVGAVAYGGGNVFLGAQGAGSFGGSGAAILAMVTNKGSLAWSVNLSSTSNVGVGGVVAMPNGDVIAAADDKSSGKTLVARYSNTGTKTWTAQLSPPAAGVMSFSFLEDVAVLGNLVVVGGAFGTSNAQATRWLAAVDAQGKQQWNMSAGQGAVWGLRPDGETIVASGFDSAGGGRNAWMARLDANGQLHWQKTPGSSGDDAVGRAAVVPSGLVFTGERNGAGWTTGDMWLLRTDKFGHDTCAAAGVCMAKEHSDCSDGNPCTTDGCNPQSGCSHAASAQGALCGAGKTCQAGGCK